MTALSLPGTADPLEESGTIAATILAGLHTAPKTLPATLFYDAEGAALFEAICELPEYYLTRTEESLLDAHASEIAALMGSRVALIELGSGAATKVRPLLAALTDPAAYIPVDVAREQLLEVATERAREFPAVDILPVWADYSQGVTLPELDEHARRVVFFPGSTIGNLHPDEASALLQMMRALVGTDGGLLLGVDRRKGTDILHPAYNDAAGVTAQFNLNSLQHLNREFGGTFDLAAFRHRAIFNPVASRIEMHLDAVAATKAQVLGEVFQFAQGESIRTEVSYKYDRTMLDQVAASGGWQVHQLFTDPRDWFWVVWLEPVQD